MQAPALKFVSEEEYWTLEETSPVRHEYWDGQLWAMAGGTANHSALTVRIAGLCDAKLRGKSCRVFGSDLRVKVAKSNKQFNTYPDVSIACPPFEWEKKRSNVKDTLLNPRVLFEVLSPSTSDYDRTLKFDQYKLIESLSDYVIIWQDRVRIEHFHRENERWMQQSFTRRTDTFELPDLEVTLSLEEIYEGVDVPEDLRLIPDLEDED
ncbi:MAG TPA: Uma2 family endonuclease [Abditibacteriaceae bacterium]|jgi:Uma2 family endonuclease